jgi:uncharacterized repeat protein (TIGR01451 family)
MKTTKTPFRMLRWGSLLPLPLVLFALFVAPLPAGLTSNPTSGTLNPTTGTFVTWVGTATGGASNGEDTCQPGVNCDSYTLTLTGTPTDWLGKRARVRVNWTLAATDYDVYIHKGTINGPIVAQSAQGTTTEEVALLDPAAVGTGAFVVNVVYFAATAADQYNGRASVENTPGPPPPPNGPIPRFFNYAAPNGLGTGAGEPTLGVNWNTGNVMFVAGLQTLRVRFDDCSSPAKATWTDVTAPLTGLTTLDPMLFTDSDVSGPNAAPLRTNRTFVAQLAGGMSVGAYTDDDGISWSQGPLGGPGSAVDHQTIGGGPYNDSSVPPPPPHPNYPHAVYYASQDIGFANISRSDNGGVSFGPAVPMWTLADCGGLHGHIKVAGDGTVYVPNKGCGGQQGFAFSLNNGVSWTIFRIPNSTPGQTDPSIGIGSDGTIYFGYDNGDGRPRIATLQRSGSNFTVLNDTNVGANIIGEPLPILHTVFPAVVAGDGDRAAMFFLGTNTGPGDATGTDQVAPFFTGAWYGYIAVTYDRGATWTTVNVTPNDPVQLGVVCTSGTTCPTGTRNLLDFNDLTLDARGRILAAYADGCTSPQCVARTDRNSDGAVNRLDNDGAELATIIRQAGGKGLFARYDVAEPGLPAAPMVSANYLGPGLVRVSWMTPDNGGAAIIGYKVYRATMGGAEALLATVGQVNSYDDYTVVPGQSYSYRVTAVNTIGEGPSCGRVTPEIPPSPCTEPGLFVLQDQTGDALDGQPYHDIQEVSVAEPFALAPDRLVFTIKLASLSTVPPDHIWPVTFKAPGGADYFVKMETNAVGAVSFAYGSGTNVTAAGTPADPASNFNANGTIRIVVPRSGIGNPTVGQNLTDFLMRVRINAMATTLTPDNVPDSLAPTGSYTIIGNATCQPADLAISKMVSAGTVNAGDSLTYTIMVTNNGPGPAATVTVADTLPSALGSITCLADSGGVCGGSGNNRLVSFNSLASGTTATITLTGTVACTTPNNTILSNTAVASSAITPDPVLTNNASSPPATTLVSSTGTGFSAPGECFAYDGGTATVMLNGNPACLGGVTSDQTWLVINNVSGGVVNYTVQPNPNYTRRSATLTAGNFTFKVRQGQLFDDVATSHPFHSFIGKLSANGITVGCGDGRNYCPNAPVSREQMPIFIMRALGELNPPTPPSQRFNDVGPERGGYRFIDRLAALGITVGCAANPPLYCPDSPVTREQMAIFIIRALGEFSPPNPPSQRFNDVGPERGGYRFVDRLAALGITQGCSASPPLYCPDASTTRGEMAVFLTRAFGCPNPRLP